MSLGLFVLINNLRNFKTDLAEENSWDVDLWIKGHVFTMSFKICLESNWDIRCNMGWKPINMHWEQHSQNQRSLDELKVHCNCVQFQRVSGYKQYLLFVIWKMVFLHCIHNVMMDNWTNNFVANKPIKCTSFGSNSRFHSDVDSISGIEYRVGGGRQV